MRNAYEIRGDITAIFLKRNDGSVMETVIDTVDLPKLLSLDRSWFAQYNPSVRGYYVATHRTKYDYVYLHRFLLDEPKDCLVDHIDRVTLNNRRKSNLRVLSPQNSVQNRGVYANNTSGVRGVTWNKEKKKWKARVSHGGREVYTKYFDSLEEAAEAVKKARARIQKYATD